MKMSRVVWLIIGGLAWVLASCSSAKKKTTPELSDFLGKKVALVSIEGEPSAKKIAEVALINQLVRRGTFILISKQDVQKAASAPDQNPMDLQAIAKRAGAEFALEMKVLQFDAPISEGYSTEEEVDSQLGEEQGTDGKTERVFKVKSMDGHVRIQLRFTHLTDNEVRTGIAESEKRVEESANHSSIHLPPQLRFLESLSNQAFQDFFEQYK